MTTHTQGENSYGVPHEIVATADRPEGAGRDAGAAIPRGDASRIPAARPGGGEARASRSGLLCATRPGPGVPATKRRGHRFRALIHLPAPCPVPKPHTPSVGPHI